MDNIYWEYSSENGIFQLRLEINVITNVIRKVRTIDGGNYDPPDLDSVIWLEHFWTSFLIIVRRPSLC